MDTTLQINAPATFAAVTAPWPRNGAVVKVVHLSARRGRGRVQAELQSEGNLSREAVLRFCKECSRMLMETDSLTLLAEHEAREAGMCTRGWHSCHGHLAVHGQRAHRCVGQSLGNRGTTCERARGGAGWGASVPAAARGYEADRALGTA